MTLFRYVLREYFKFVFGTLMLCIFLFVLFDFIHKTTNYFAKYNPSPELIVKFYIFQLPFQIVQALPIAALLASVVCMVLLNRSNEVTAMRAAGMGPLAIAAPLAVGGLLLSLVSYAIGELVVPLSAQRMHFVTKVRIEGDKDYSLEEQSHWLRSGQDIFNFQDYDYQTQALRGIKLVSVDKSFVPRQALHAELALFQPQTRTWHLEKVSQLSFKANGELERLSTQASMDRVLPVEPGQLKTERRLPDEMALDELGELIGLGQETGADVLGLRIAWHVKWAYPLAAFLISLLGIKFGYRSERTTETVKSVLLAFAVGISYWFVMSAARALAGAGDIPPFWAGWLANLFIFVIVSLQLWKVNRI